MGLVSRSVWLVFAASRTRRRSALAKQLKLNKNSDLVVFETHRRSRKRRRRDSAAAEPRAEAEPVAATAKHLSLPKLLYCCTEKN